MKYLYYKKVIYNSFYEMIKGWYDNHPNKISISILIQIICFIFEFNIMKFEMKY